MNRRYYKYLFLIWLLFICVLIIILKPHRFQKWNSIKPISQYKGDRELKKNYLNIQKFLTNIPYQANSSFSYLVNPRDKYKNAIIEGNGDCSNFSFGGAYFLLKNNIEFEILHFFIPETFFIRGGHVALRIPYILKDEKGTGVLDLAGGGTPKFKNKIADYSDLIDKVKNKEIYFDRINSEAPKFYKNYYHKDYLNKVHIGFTKSSDVRRYFNFLDNIYIPLGNKKIEKMFYDGLAILFGQYYTIYIDEELLSQFVFQIFFFKAILLFLRILLITLITIVIIELFQKFRTNSIENY